MFGKRAVRCTNRNDVVLAGAALVMALYKFIDTHREYKQHSEQIKEIPQ